MNRWTTVYAVHVCARLRLGFWQLALPFEESVVVFISKQPSFALHCPSLLIESSLHKLMLFPNIPKLRTIPKFPKLRTPQLHKREEKSVSSEDGKGGIPLCTIGAHSCPHAQHQALPGERQCNISIKKCNSVCSLHFPHASTNPNAEGHSALMTSSCYITHHNLSLASSMET